MNKILVVDDATFMRMMIKKTLNDLGYKDVEEAEDGQVAVDKFKQLSPDLVMLDITRPKLDGIGALQEIREHNPNAKVVMCSAMGQEAMVMQAIKLGAMDFIVKPFKPDRIEKTMKTIFG